MVPWAYTDTKPFIRICTADHHLHCLKISYTEVCPSGTEAFPTQRTVPVGQRPFQHRGLSQWDRGLSYTEDCPSGTEAFPTQRTVPVRQRPFLHRGLSLWDRGLSYTEDCPCGTYPVGQRHGHRPHLLPSPQYSPMPDVAVGERADGEDVGLPPRHGEDSGQTTVNWSDYPL